MQYIDIGIGTYTPIINTICNSIAVYRLYLERGSVPSASKNYETVKIAKFVFMCLTHRR